MKNHLLTLLPLLLLSGILVLPFLKNGYFPTHDGEWAVVRLSEMVRELKDHQFPPQWSQYLNHGYGYPLFLFTYPLPYYAGTLLHGVGFGLVSSIKLLFILSIIGSAISMYIFSYSIWGKAGAIISTVLYLFAPYRMANLYVRGSIGESLAFVFFPLLLFFVDRLLQTRKIPSFLALSLCFALFLLTHNAMFVLFMPFLLLWIGYRIFQFHDRYTKQRIFLLALALCLGLSLAATFWLPAIFEKKFIRLSSTPLANKEEHFITIAQLLGNTWDFGIKPPLQIGVSHLLFALGAIIVNSVLFKKNKSMALVIAISALTGISLFMLFPVSGIFWNMPLLKEIDFPWRMLGVSTFFITLLAGAISIRIKSIPILVVLAASIVMLNIQFVKTLTPVVKSDDYYATNDATTTSANELMPLTVTQDATNRPQSKIEASGVLINSVLERSSQLTLNLTNSAVSDETVNVNTIYFPGWRATLDSRKIEIHPQPQTGRIQFSLPPGSHEVRLQFKPTAVRKFANVISVSGVVISIGLWFVSRKYLHSSR